MTLLSPRPADLSPIKQQDADSDDGSPQETSDISESDVLNITVDPEECSGLDSIGVRRSNASVLSRVDSIENRLRQSNASVLSRYKVGLYAYT